MQPFQLSPLMAQFAQAAQSDYEASLAESLAEPPTLDHYLHELDPTLSLDWSGTSFWGIPELRSRILDRFGYAEAAAVRGAALTPENVLVTAGTSEAIYLAMAQVLERGDQVIVESPGWLQPQQIAHALGVEIVLWPRREEDGWTLNLDDLAARITPRTRLIYFSNPNNPTGNITDAATLVELAALARRHNLTVLSDEVYRGLEWDRNQTPHWVGFYEKAISVGSVSKLFGLQGIRIGWMLAQDRDLLTRCYRMRANTTALLNVVGEHIATIALSPARYQIARSRQLAIGRATRRTLDQIIARTSRLEWKIPRGGFLGFARCVDSDAETLVAELLAPPHRLWTIPGTVYGYPKHIRLGMGGAPAHVEAGLRRLATFLGLSDESLRDPLDPGSINALPAHADSRSPSSSVTTDVTTNLTND